MHRSTLSSAAERSMQRLYRNFPTGAFAKSEVGVGLGVSRFRDYVDAHCYNSSSHGERGEDSPEGSNKCGQGQQRAAREVGFQVEVLRVSPDWGYGVEPHRNPPRKAGAARSRRGT